MYVCISSEIPLGYIMASTFKLGVIATLLGATNNVFAGCPFLSGNEVRYVFQIRIDDGDSQMYIACKDCSIVYMVGIPPTYVWKQHQTNIYFLSKFRD